MTKERFYKESLRYVFMILACFSYALSLDIFLVPKQIVGGGISGLATLFNYVFDFNVGILIIALNVPILLLGLKTNGLGFIIRCLITTTTLGIITDGFAFLEDITQGLTSEPIMACLYGGVLQGIAVGLFCKYQVSSGGTELLGRIISKKIKIMSIPAWIALLDGIIVVAGAIVLQTPENVLFALIVIFVSAKVSDMIIMGLNHAKLCYIITEHPEEIAKCLLENSPRGITSIKGTGMYTKVEKNILMTVIKKQQLEDLKNYIRLVDKDAFVIVGETTEVLGKGFKQIEEE